MSNDIQPEIRFPGFTEAWEQRKFECLLDKKDGVRRGPFGSALKKEFFVSNSNFVVYEQQNAIYDNYETRYKITEKKYNELIKFKLEPGDFIMSGAGTIGRISRVPKQIKPGVFNQALIRLRINKEITDSEYFIQFIRADFMQRKLTGANPGSAITNLVPMSEVKKWIVQFPILEEQKKIGNFFKQLDDTIALHQRKLDLLKETKKGFLQKMFPKNGAKVPEIRFPGFTEDWEERRLQEVVDRYDNLRIPITASKRVAGNTPYYGANGIQGYVEGYTHDGEFILVAEDGANDLKNYPVQYVDGKVWVNNHAHVIQAKENLADNMFLMNAIRSINIEPFLVGGGRAKLNADVLMKLEVIIPLKSEQQKIGAFFKQLDDTIALHQRKLDLLKETKKGFLQKMFV
ncbi:restriction endonuclease subunit S [Enterococcus durans]|uniref:restriction endonuclease subunit S n=1 Tax=Enterococcus durans TaxID=53345 RepID=UPI0022E93D43|nr:restriction endonuclease subunit S [Enterococcus durans]